MQFLSLISHIETCFVPCATFNFEDLQYVECNRELETNFSKTVDSVDKETTIRAEEANEVRKRRHPKEFNGRSFQIYIELS